jgi:hypothetical protein
MPHPSCKLPIDHKSLYQVGRSPFQALVDGQERRLGQAGWAAWQRTAARSGTPEARKRLDALIDEEGPSHEVERMVL